MLVLGILLLLLAAALLVGFLSSGTQEVTFDSGVLNITVNTLTIYLLGALTLLLVVAGVALMQSGLRRANQHRKERKELSRLSEKVERQEATQHGSATETRGTTVSGEAPTSTTPTTPTTSTQPTQPTKGDTATGGEGSHRA